MRSNESVSSAVPADRYSVGAEEVGAFSKGELEFEPKDGGVVEVEEGALLDAWYASFASQATIALVSARRQQEVVIGDYDDRVQVTATTRVPWLRICSLLITAADGSRWIGTGWLAGPRLVVTAGHCVFIRDRGGWVRQIEVIPGRDASYRPYGACVATIFRSVTGWTEQDNRDFDYGGILLPEGRAFGSRLGTFGYRVLPDTEILALLTNISGYPGDREPGTQWRLDKGRTIVRATPTTVIYDFDTYGGQSGAPVWQLLANRRTVVGIHTNGHSSGNSATRITSDVFANIERWREEAGA